MSWWEQPYRGGGPAKVKGFPRALYPPDAEQYGKQPSSRGSDVIAYKRTLCRLGRWGVWEPSRWDDGYWNEFAHGTPGPDVENSGVAGFQYQQKIDATGWLGKKTFDNLRYALVPQGFPHAGEQAMDSVACSLIDEAFVLFHGHDDAPSAAKKTVRQSALERAITQLGYSESPPNSNANKFGSWYGMNHQPWCACFVTWCFELGAGDLGKDSPAFVKGQRYAYVPYLVGDARAARYGLRTVDADAVQPGDPVAYDWSWDAEYDHVGVFEKWIGPSTFYAIEGNTSTSSNSNGGQVMRRTRTLGQQATVFVRVSEP